MTIDLHNNTRWDNHPLTRLYLQIASNAESGFNCRELIKYFDTTLEVARGERFRKQKIRGLALKLFTRLDGNRDGLICIKDLRAQLDRIRKVFAPAIVQDNTQITLAAQRRFKEISSDEILDYPKLREHIRGRLPFSLPFRGLIAQTASLILMNRSKRSPPIGESAHHRRTMGRF